MRSRWKARRGSFDWDVVTDGLVQEQMRAGHDPDSVATTPAWMAETVIHPEDVPRVEATLEDHLAENSLQVTIRLRLTAFGIGCMRAGVACATRRTPVGSLVDHRRLRAKAGGDRQEQLRRATAPIAKNGGIGTLAGGIASRFQQYPGAILGYAGTCLNEVTAGSAVRLPRQRQRTQLSVRRPGRPYPSAAAAR